MTQTYHLNGLTCENCVKKVKKTILSIEAVTAIEISTEKNLAEISMNQDIPLREFQDVLESKYQISNDTTNSKNTSWLSTYKPILLIFIYLFATVSFIEFTAENIDLLRWMRHFMSGFFLIFSFFKILNLRGFNESYKMYDIIAKKFPNWGYIYAFIELLLGIALLLNFRPVITHSICILIMSLSIIGVLKTVFEKKEIKCACLGDIFNLPMSTITIIEDGLMIAMSITMLLITLN